MKKTRFLTFVLTIATLLLSACGTANPTPVAPEAAASAKAIAMPVAFVGIVDSIAGDQWVISGTTVTVDPSIVRDGPFNVGDQVKVEGHVSPDGSFTVSRVEVPTPQETATTLPFSDDNSNDSSINSNTNDDRGSSMNTNDDNSNSANTNDDQGVDANTNDDHGQDTNINDDHGGSTNTNDDSSNSANANDDSSNGGNVNDDHGGSNSNDSSGNDNSSGSGSDDHGSGGNSNDD